MLTMLSVSFSFLFFLSQTHTTAKIQHGLNNMDPNSTDYYILLKCSFHDAQSTFVTMSEVMT